MSVKNEIERKFLLEFPVSWSALAEMLDNVVNIQRISQSYLKKKNSEKQSARVRKSVEGLSGDKNIIYTYNRKEKIDTATRRELEKEISKKEYEKQLKESDPDRYEVSKIRFVFDYSDQCFELDIFRGHLKGLAILEIELDHKNDKVELPPYLNIIREVTDEKGFSNFSLSRKDIKLLWR